MDARPPGADLLEQRRHEVLRQASAALAGRPVTLWEVSPRAEVLPVVTTGGMGEVARGATDLASTLAGWGTSIIQGSRWVGCRLDDRGAWCVAPVRTLPPAPPPSGVERRGRERLTLELAGLCVGLMDGAPRPRRPRLGEPDALVELARHPAVIAHEVANPLTAALAGLDLYKERVQKTSELAAGLRAELLEELANVETGIEKAIAFLRSIQDRARGALARSERFDAGHVVRSCVTLERPLAHRRGVALEAGGDVRDVFLQGDPNALYQVLTNLVRNAVEASRREKTAVVLSAALADATLRITVQDRGVGIAPEHLDRIFEAGFTTRSLGAGSGTGLTVVREIVEDVFGGRVGVESSPGRGSTFTVEIPVPLQRAKKAAGEPEPR